MVSQVLMPQMGLEVTEGTVMTVLVSLGDRVAAGDAVVEVETDKALTDIVAPRDGVVVGIQTQVGDTVPIGATLLLLGDEAGETAEPGGEPAEPAEPGGEPDAGSDDVTDERELTSVGAAAPAGANGSVADTGRGAHRLRVAPVARRAAAHHGLTLTSLTGTGPHGRITLRDVEHAVAGRGSAQAPAPVQAAATPALPSAAASDGATIEPLTPTRRAIARRMSQSAQIPQFTLHRDIELDWLTQEKARLTASGPAKLSVNDLLVQALAETVGRHDVLAAAYVEAGPDGTPHLQRSPGVHVGLAVAGDRGLLVPVLRDAHSRTLPELALERSRLVGLARSGRLDRTEMTGATISLSSLAAFGVDRFNALLNPGETAILAVGRTREALVPRDGGIALVHLATFTLTLDHRVADGATGAAALADLTDLLEGAMTWRT